MNARRPNAILVPLKDGVFYVTVDRREGCRRPTDEEVDAFAAAWLARGQKKSISKSKAITK
jgi:hypothetical protein